MEKIEFAFSGGMYTVRPRRRRCIRCVIVPEFRRRWVVHAPEYQTVGVSLGCTSRPANKQQTDIASVTSDGDAELSAGFTESVGTDPG